MPVHPSEVFICSSPGRATCALRLTGVKGWFCCFRLFGCGFLVGFFGGVLVVGVVLWFGLPGRFPEPAHHPQ